MDLEKFSEGFGSFLEANRAWIIAVAAVVLVVGALVLIRARKKKTGESAWTIRELSAAAMCLALGFLLSFIKLWQMPQGGSVTLASMLPVMLFAYIYGTPKGLLVGFAYALLQCLQDFWVVHWAQFFLDYIFAFTILGLAGLFKKSILPGMILACVLRYASHVISGVIFFASYAAESGQELWPYSLGYNSFVLIDLAICIVIVVIPPVSKMIQQVKRQALKPAPKSV
ncbi:MAG: energy-coupled thiamine transporter ThiT [Burkholderiales bacterium]